MKYKQDINPQYLQNYKTKTKANIFEFWIKLL